MKRFSIGIVIVALIVVGGYFVLNRDISTRDQEQIKPVAEAPNEWVRYNNENLGITFLIPADWNIEELESVFQLYIESPNVINLMTIDGETESIIFYFNIRTPDNSRPDKILNKQYAFSSTSKELGSEKLLKDTFLTLHNYKPGVSDFSVTQQQYTVNDTQYKPALRIDGMPYEIWGGIAYPEENFSAPRITLEQFNSLEDFNTVQEILQTLDSL